MPGISLSRICLVAVLGMMCFMISPLHATEETPAEANEPCETGEPCAEEADKEELERGFDPCLINASLPACKSEGENGDSGGAERASPEQPESGDSGSP